MTGQLRFPAFALGLVLSLLGLTPPLRAADTAIIRIRPESTISSNTVRLGDVADINAHSATLRTRLERLDLAELQDIDAGETISARQVLARLLIDGFDRSSVKLTGAPEVHVQRQSPRGRAKPTTHDHDLANVIRDQVLVQLSTAWLVAFDDVEVRLVTAPGSVQTPPAGAIPDVELPDRPEPGRISIRVRWLKDDQIVRTDPLAAEVRLRQQVLVAAAAVSRGEVLTAEHLVEDRRMLSSRVAPISAQETVGHPLRRSLAPGELITSKDVSGAGTSPVQIRARDLVRVVARKGTLTVRLQAAEALQPGRLGDTIRVRNTQSGRVMAGKVVSPKEVEINLE